MSGYDGFATVDKEHGDAAEHLIGEVEKMRPSISGVVTAANWLMGPDGEKYLYFFSRGWTILTDQTFGDKLGLDKFRSTEHWQLVVLSEQGSLLLMIPGCQVQGFLTCALPPDRSECLVV